MISVRVKMAREPADQSSDDENAVPARARRWSASSAASADAGWIRRGQRDAPRGSVASGQRGQGSGFFISADGYAVTNNHVVDGADEVEVTTDDGKTYSAKVIGTDPRTDSR